jgi:hypothetical protein
MDRKMKKKNNRTTIRPKRTGGKLKKAKPVQLRRRPVRQDSQRGYDNSVAVPAAAGVMYTNQGPRVGGGNFTISHTEFVATLVVDGKVNAYAINPGNGLLFPWLATVASNFEYYRFIDLEFEIKSSLPTSSPGNTNMVVDYDSRDDTLADKATILNYQGANRAPIWIPSFRTRAVQNAKLYVLAESQPSDTDIRLYNLGNFNYFIDTSLATDTVVGDLFVKYKVELLVPIIGPTAPLLFYGPPMAYSWGGFKRGGADEPFANQFVQGLHSDSLNVSKSTDSKLLIEFSQFYDLPPGEAWYGTFFTFGGLQGEDYQIPGTNIGNTYGNTFMEATGLSTNMIPYPWPGQAESSLEPVVYYRNAIHSQYGDCISGQMWKYDKDASFSNSIIEFSAMAPLNNSNDVQYGYMMFVWREQVSSVEGKRSRARVSRKRGFRDGKPESAFRLAAKDIPMFKIKRPKLFKNGSDVEQPDSKYFQYSLAHKYRNEDEVEELVDRLQHTKLETPKSQSGEQFVYVAGKPGRKLQ